MTVYKTRQYRPVSTAETTAGDGASVRAILDLADGINNYLAYVGRPKLVSEMFINPIQSGDGVTSEKVVLPPFAPRLIPRGYSQVRWTIRHERIAGADDTVWRLYANRILYRGPLTLDTSYLYLQQVSQITTSSDDPAINYEETSLKLVRDKTNMVWFLLTAQNADLSTRSQVTSLDVWGIE